MPVPATSQNGQEKERPDKGNHPEKQRLDKLLQTCRHERTDDGDRSMAPAQDTGNLLGNNGKR